jgi:glycosyltransferase involved in cell wall biosynthesis
MSNSESSINIPLSQMTAIVIPLYNEATGAVELIRRIEQATKEQIFFLFIDDGSSDNTVEILRSHRFRDSDSRRIIQLSRNFGHQPALYTGLTLLPPHYQKIVVMDGDLQDQPEDIPKLLKPLADGFDCAYAVRKPKSANYLIDVATGLFYKIQIALSPFPIPRFAGTFCAFNRSFLDSLLMFKEVDVYFPGLRAYVGLKQIAVNVERAHRKHGKSKVGLLGLLRLSITGLFGFSAAPMRSILICGALITIFFFLFAISFVALYLLGIIATLATSLLAILVLLLFGIQMMFIGIVGEYIGKLFVESKRRPRSIIASIIDE